MKALVRHVQLKDIAVGGMRKVTNNGCAAEQIKSDKVENVAIGGAISGEYGKVDKPKSTVMDGVSIGKVGTS